MRETKREKRIMNSKEDKRGKGCKRITTHVYGGTILVIGQEQRNRTRNTDGKRSESSILYNGFPHIRVTKRLKMKGDEIQLYGTRGPDLSQFLSNSF